MRNNILFHFSPELSASLWQTYLKKTITMKIRIFISYSHKDEALKEKLITSLARLEREELIESWHDRQITAGSEWKGKIDKALNAANLILLLVSPDFINSKYCYDIEMRRALERQWAAKAKVIPLILRPSDWKSTPLGQLQVLPKNAKPVTRWKDQDEAFLEVVQGMRDAIEELKKIALSEQDTELEELIDELCPLILEQTATIWLTLPEEEPEETLEKQLRKIGKRKAVASGTAVFRSFEEELTEMIKLLFPFEYEVAAHIAVAQAMIHIFENHPLTHQQIEEQKREPSNLLNQLRPHAPPDFNARQDPTQTKLYESVLLQLLELSIDLLEALPTWNQENLLGLLKNHEVLLRGCRRVLEEKKRLIESHSQDIGGQWEREFRSVIARRFDVLNLFGVDVSKEAKRHQLSVAYIALAMENISDSDDLQLGESLPAQTLLLKHPRMVIQGIAGQGKTTLLQWITVMCGRQQFKQPLENWNSKIPFFVKLRVQLNQGLPKYQELPILMTPEIRLDQQHDKWTQKVLQEGRAIVMVDGLDEVPKEKREEVREWLEFMCGHFSENHFILTSRPAAYEKAWLQSLDFVEMELQPMDFYALQQFIDHWHRAVSLAIAPDQPDLLAKNAKNMLQAMKEKKSLRTLAQNPLLCAMICALHHDRHGVLPSKKTEIYESAISMLLGRRDLERKVEHRDLRLEKLDYTDKRVFLNHISRWMMFNEQPMIQRKDFLARLQEKIDLVKVVRENQLSAQELLEYFLERSGLLREDVPNQIDFVHRTFQEYMAAQSFVDDNSHRFLLKQAGNDQWNEIIELAAGLFPPQIGNEFVTFLLKIAEKNPQRAGRLYILAMGCCETLPQVHPKLQKTVEQKIKAIVPPRTTEARATLINAGEIAIPFLARKPKRPLKDDLYCVMTLIQMRNETTYPVLLEYLEISQSVYAKNMAFLLRRINREAILQSGLVELILRKGTHHYPLPILESLVAATVDFRLYENIPEKQLHFSEEPFEMGLIQNFDWYVPPNKQNAFVFHLKDCQFLPSIKHLAGSEVVIDTITLNDIPTLQEYYQLRIKLNKLDFPITPETLLSFRKCNQLQIKLDELDLSGEKIDELSFLIHFPQLQTLHVYDAQVSDLSPLQKCTQLKELSVSNTQVSNLSPLAKCPQLYRLEVDRTQVSDLSPLQKCTQLKELDVSDTQVSDLRRLAKCFQLYRLEVDRTKVSDLSPLQKCTQLKELDVSDTQVSDLSPLQKCTQLQRLNVSNTQVSDLSPLQKCTQLQELNVSNTQVSNLSPLAKCPQLYRLVVDRTQVSDLSPLQKCTQLQTLFIPHTQVSDLSPLQKCTQLKELLISVRLDTSPLDELVRQGLEIHEW